MHLMKKKKADILIIGAGPSGMVAAGYLEKKGISVIVLEKQKFPRFTIGESLIPRCMDNFQEAGFLDVLTKQNYQKKFGARFIRKNEIAEFDFSKKYGEGWDWTWQVPRAHFDKVLTDEIEGRGVPIYFETEVISLIYENETWKIKTQNEQGETEIFESKFIIDSSGNGRVLARQLNLEAPPKIDDHSSIFTHIEETGRPHGKEGEQISFEVIEKDFWFWYIPFSNGKTSLGFVGHNRWFEKYQGRNAEMFSNMLDQTQFYKERFSHYTPDFEPALWHNISRNVQQIYGKGYALTGNSAEFLDPVFSSGVAFATESGLLAAKLAAKQIEGIEVNWQTEYAAHIKRGVDVFSTYVKEWYSGKLQDIFFHPEPSPLIKEQICAVLAGYVWDTSNPFVRNHQKAIRNLHRIISSAKTF